MKAVVCTEFGVPEKLVLRDVPTPSPKPDEVLIKIHRTTVTVGDWRIWSRTMPKGFGIMSYLIFGFKSPRTPIFGTEIAGEVAGVGSNVTKFKAGDHVIALAGMGLGAHAEYRCVREKGAIAVKPQSLSFEDAISVCFGGLTALDYLERAGIKANERVLVNGASGVVGIAAVLLLKRMGVLVTAICSGERADALRSVGVKDVIDYKKEDLLKRSEHYDVIVDCAGNLTYKKCKHLLSQGGRLILVAAGLPDMLGSMKPTGKPKHRVIVGAIKESSENLQKVLNFCADGTLKPAVGFRCALENIAQAYAYVGSPHKKGTAVVHVTDV